MCADEDAPRPLPAERIDQHLVVEPDLPGPLRMPVVHAGEALARWVRPEPRRREQHRVAIGAPGRMYGAAVDYVPGRVGPLDLGAVAHAAASSFGDRSAALRKSTWARMRASLAWM